MKNNLCKFASNYPLSNIEMAIYIKLHLEVTMRVGRPARKSVEWAEILRPLRPAPHNLQLVRAKDGSG